MHLSLSLSLSLSLILITFSSQCINARQIQAAFPRESEQPYYGITHTHTHMVWSIIKFSKLLRTLKTKTEQNNEKGPNTCFVEEWLNLPLDSTSPLHFSNTNPSTPIFPKSGSGNPFGGQCSAVPASIIITNGVGHCYVVLSNCSDINT